MSVTLTRLVNEWLGLGPGDISIMQALLASAMIVPAVLLMRRKIDRKSFRGLGLGRRSTRAATIGVVVGLGTACLVWAPAFCAGWIALERVDLAQLLKFITVNTLILLLYEALPEELALRGYAWAIVSENWSPFVATIAVTALFPLSSLVISVIQTGAALLLGAGSSGIALAPQGSDPVAYGLQLILFGLALCAARRIPIPGVLAMCVAFHVVQLSVNRVLLGGLGWLDSGVTTVFVEPDAIALVLVHVMLSGMTFLTVRKALERHSDNRSRTSAA